MAYGRITRAVGENALLIKKDDESESKEYVGLDVDRIIVGVETDEVDADGNQRREIVTNSLGLNEARVAVEAQEIYNAATRRRRNWFMLDLETGRRGWFPGCVVKGDLLSDTELYGAPSDAASVIETISAGTTVTLLDVDTIDQEPLYDGWYRILHDTQGYVKKDKVSNIRYDSPTIN